ncbi:MAG: ATP-binding cassette domain-containing protein [Deltaproteobacteria bacterium]|nr:ATP-binding cassette domain-containing protein [Deltaproteobacteria bacterium]
MIEVKRLVYGYQASEKPVLNGIDLTVRQGEYVALIGPNGSGKTTFVKHLNALLVPLEGSVSVDGMDTRNPRDVPEIRRRVGMVFQDPDSQIVGMTVEEDLAFGPGNLRLPPQQIRRLVDDTLAKLGLSGLAKRIPHTLSGGEKRLVAIAGVLIMKPRCLVLDEPTAYLDPAGRQRVLGIIRELNNEGITVLHIAHDLQDIADASRIVLMNGGTVLLDGAPGDILNEGEILETLNLAVPPITELMRRLREQGWSVATNVLTVQEALVEIMASLPGKKGEAHLCAGGAVEAVSHV